MRQRQRCCRSGGDGSRGDAEVFGRDRRTEVVTRPPYTAGSSLCRNVDETRADQGDNGRQSARIRCNDSTCFPTI